MVYTQIRTNNVGPDLGPNFAKDISRLQKERVNYMSVCQSVNTSAITLWHLQIFLKLIQGLIYL